MQSRAWTQLLLDRRRERAARASEQRREQQEMTVAARLLRDEVLDAQSAIEDVLDRGRWPTIPIATHQWQLYCATAARLFPTHGWNMMCVSSGHIMWVNQKGAETPDGEILDHEREILLDAMEEMTNVEEGLRPTRPPE